jgi:hypothetical protein
MKGIAPTRASEKPHSQADADPIRWMMLRFD